MHTHTKSQSGWIVFLDLLCLVASIMLATSLRFGPEEMAQFVVGRLDGWLLFVGSILIANYVAGSYRIQFTLSRFNLVVTWLFSVSVAVLILSVTSYAWLQVLLGRGVLGLAVLFYSILSLYLRLFVLRAIFRFGGIVNQVLIMIDGGNECRMRNYLENPYILPQHRTVGWLQVKDEYARVPAREGNAKDGIPVIEVSPDEILDVIRSLDVSLLVTGRNTKDLSPDASRILRRARFSGTEVLTPLAVCEEFCGRVPLDLVRESDIRRHGFESQVPVIFRVKRFCDLCACIIGGIVCLPVGLLVAALIKISEPHAPILFKQSRAGQFGKVFRIYKFRTMRVGADEWSGPVWSPLDDPRITPLGRILRMFRLDELPQLLNVLRGDMSLVGPRPEQPGLVDELAEKIPFYREREYALPGLTGWAQINSLYGNSVESTRRKVEYDLYYIKNMSISLDLQIILRTFRIVLLGKEKRE
jgi:exopolysaccharide biosynthesis polyprenyl glycosylphosphotransferase